MIELEEVVYTMIKNIASILGMVLNWIYNNIAFQNYGLAIIIFTVMVRLILIPLAIRQYQTNQKMKIIRPKLDELKKKYGDDMQKYNMEAAKLYQDIGGYPFGGCLIPLLQLPVMWALFYVVREPLTYMKMMSSSEIAKWISLVPPDRRITGAYEQIAAVAYNKLLNMNFLGLDLANIPKLQFNSVLLLPILAIITSYLVSKFGSSMMDDENNKQSNLLRFVMEPIITAIIVFKVPVSLCVYWITANLLQIVQQWYMDKYIKDDV